MKCENMVGKAFGNISQRLIYGYLCSYPEFEPIPSVVSRESQKQMYDFLWEFVSGIYSDPQKLGLPVDEDDWLGDRQLNKARPQLIKRQQKIVKAVKEFYIFLYSLGEYGTIEGNKLYISKDELKIKKKHLMFLEQFGVTSKIDDENIVFSSEAYPEIFPAWKLLSQISSERNFDILYSFPQCLYSNDNNYVLKTMEALCSSNEFTFSDLDSYFTLNGYETYYNYREYEFPDFQSGGLGVLYKKDGEKRFHVHYDMRKLNQIHYALRLSRFRAIWDRSDELSDTARQFLFDVTNRCRDCGECAKRKFKTMGPFEAENKGEIFTLCPWFPHTGWRYLDSEKVEVIRELLALQEKVI